MKRWWGARCGDVTTVDIDLRAGGAWRYATQVHGHGEMAFHGEYREVVPGARLVSTEVYEAMPDEEALNTLAFTERGGRTTLRILVQHRSRATRDARLQSGMLDALDLLEQVALTLA